MTKPEPKPEPNHVLVVVSSVFVALLFLYACCRRKAQPVTDEPRSMMWESILGAEPMPDTQVYEQKH